MAGTTNKLTATGIKHAVRQGHQGKMADGGGLTLFLRPNGHYWWFRYRFGGKERTLSLGSYPEVTLAQARERRDEARRLLAEGVDPSAQRKAARAARTESVDNTFDAVAREWYETRHRNEVVESHATRNWRRLERHTFPTLARRPIAEIEPPEVLQALRRIEDQGYIETAQRVRALIGQVFRYAVATGRARRDITTDLRDALRTPETKHHAAITDPAEIGALLHAVDGYGGEPTTRAALQLAPLVFTRPGDLRQLKWEDLDLEAAEWRLVATKNGEPLIVPLPDQALAILREMEPLTGKQTYVFASNRTRGRPMSNMTLNAALRRLGYGGQIITAHGFRAMARTVLVEHLNYPVELVEMQLGHRVRDVHGRAYNRTQWLQERRAMMQAWADYLQDLAAPHN